LFLTVTGITFYLGAKLTRKVENPQPVFRVSFEDSKYTHEFDPSKISFMGEYFYLEHLFAPLVDFNTHGQIVSSIADTFEWDDNTLVFTFPKNLTTADGHMIGADDAAFSLKRTLFLASNSHGNLANILCPNEKFLSMESTCAGIEVREHTLRLTAFKHKNFLLEILTSIDFAVLPRSSVNPVTLKITDYRNTSGAYFLESESKGLKILKPNLSHARYNANMPQSVEIVTEPIAFDPAAADAIKAFSLIEVEHVPTATGTICSEVVGAYENSKQTSNLHKTLPISLSFLAFTRRGKDRLSPPERLGLGSKLQSLMNEARKEANKIGCSEPTQQFFPPQSSGQLSETQLLSLQSQLQLSEVKAIDSKLKIGVSPFMLDFYSKVIKSNPDQFEVVSLDSADWALSSPSPANVDAVFLSTDTSIREDITGLAYSLGRGHFGLTKEQGDIWLDKYMETEDQTARLTLLKELHYNALVTDPSIVPLFFKPYFALTRKPWTTNFSKLSAGNPLWEVRYSP
jgi:hypothetical protein